MFFVIIEFLSSSSGHLGAAMFRLQPGQPGQVWHSTQAPCIYVRIIFLLFASYLYSNYVPIIEIIIGTAA